jgi:Protein of unknown function (DUF3307)
MKFLAWCFILHFIGDFLLQSRWMAENKGRLWSALGAHIGILTLVFAAGTGSLSLAICNGAVHALIDRNIWNGYKWYRRGEDIATFQYWKDHLFWATLGLDQMLHGLTILWLVSLFA